MSNSHATFHYSMQTPLHLAAIGGYPKCIEVLLRHGANPYLRNDATELPLHLAAGKPTCERLLGKACEIEVFK